MSEGFQLPLNAATRFCGVLGHPVRHSASPAMQNAALAALELDWRYLALEVHPDDLRAAIQGAKVAGFIGLNLTVPHKLLAVDLVDVIDPAAKMWGAVNTIRFEGLDSAGSWRPVGEFTANAPREVRSHGFNTDADAITRSIREDLGIELHGAAVLLLGAGGAGRVAALKLAAEGLGQLFLVNRTMGKAEDIAREIRERHPEVKVETGYPTATLDLVLNATSLGLKPGDGVPFDASAFSLGRARAAYDMIYRPAETPFLAAAKAAGIPTANGVGMLLYQGARALELWTGREAPVSIMREALLNNIYGR